MQKERSWEFISSQGRKVKNIWKTAAKNNNLEIEIFGLDALPTFSFKSVHSQVFKTYLTQEMLKFGFLAGTAFYTSTSHSDNILVQYEDKIEKVFKKISSIWDHTTPHQFLDSEIASTGFARLN